MQRPGWRGGWGKAGAWVIGSIFGLPTILFFEGHLCLTCGESSLIGLAMTIAIGFLLLFRFVALYCEISLIMVHLKSLPEKGKGAPNS